MPEATTGSAPPIIFISYSRKDAKWRDFVEGHLAPAAQHGHFETWDDRRIDAGVDWKAEIDAALAKCAAFILLVSHHSLASRFILDAEVKTALEAYWNRGVPIYPIIVSACDIHAVSWLARMNLRPRDAKPLALYSPARRDEVMASLAKEIREIINKASATKPGGTSSHADQSTRAVAAARRTQPRRCRHIPVAANRGPPTCGSRRCAQGARGGNGPRPARARAGTGRSLHR